MPTPADFLWGVAIASHQNEGAAPASDWAEAEAAGRFPHESGEGARFREHFEQDLDLLANDVGAHALRTSIEWARLEPRPGYFDPNEVAYLHQLFSAAKARQLKLIVTLHHFTSPAWINAGFYPTGWENPKTALAFERYADFVAREFGNEIDYFLTFNEPSNLLVGGFFAGRIPPFRWGPLPILNAAKVMIDAHRRAYEAIHAVLPKAMVSFTEFTGLLALAGFRLAYEPGKLLATFMERGRDGKPKHVDFTSMHYYGDVPLQETGTYPLRHDLFGISPDGFETMLRKTWEHYGLPILVAENGMATRNHEPRSDNWTPSRYMVAHVRAMERAMEAGVPVIGYLWWTLTDNYEWGTFDSRFGLYRVDCHAGDYSRIATPAVDTYRRIIGARGVPSEL
jgi:beta-glucosidase